MEAVLDFPALQKATDLKRVGDVAKCLERQGIRFFHGKKGTIWTTMDLVARAAYGETVSGSNDLTSPENFL